MKEKENPAREKKEFNTLTVTVSICGEPKTDDTCKSASLKFPMPLVRKIEGPFTEEGKLVEEMIADKEYIFKATEFQESTLSPIKHIWWAEKLDDGEITDLEYKKGENPYLDEEGTVCFKYIAKKAEKIRIYAYVASPAEKVSIEMPIVTFPFCVDRFKVPGLNRKGDNIAQDLTYGKGIAVKTANTVYNTEDVERYIEEYKKDGFNINKHGIYANTEQIDSLDTSSLDDFEYSKPQAGSDYFASFQRNTEDAIKSKIIEDQAFAEKARYKKAIYSKERIYDAKAWLIENWVYELSGIDVKDYHEGNLLFWDTSDENLFKAFEDWATLCYSYGKMQGNIERMIAKFKRNEGGIYEDPILTDDIAKHEETLEYCTNLEDFIAEKIKNSNGKLSDIIEKKIDFTYDHRGKRGKTTAENKNFAKPTFGKLKDTIKGETIALNDIWATEVNIIGVEYEKTNYKIKYQVTLWDHFGLDITDIEALPNTIPIAKEAFAVWFALQHLRGYKPFITKMTFEKEFSGSIKKGKIERYNSRIE